MTSAIISIIVALIPIAAIIVIAVILVKLAKKHLVYKEEQIKLLREIRDNQKNNNGS